MSFNVLLFLTLRVLHVVLAGIWLGSAFFITLYLAPATEQAGPAGGQVMAALVKRGMVTAMAILAGTTILTGLYLFWRFTGGFDPAVSASRAGMAYSLGALAGFIAAILGGSVIGRGAKRMTALGAKAASAPQQQRGAVLSEMAAIQARVTLASRIVLVLLIFAMAAMSLGHYI